MGTPSGQQPLLFALGVNAVQKARKAEPETHWSLQRRHPDGERWLEVGRFPSKEVAALALEALVAKDHGDSEDFRIRKVRIEPHG